MKNDLKKQTESLPKTGLLSIVTVILMAFCFASCDNDEPENNDNNGQATSIVSANELAGEWTLVKDVVLYSKTDTSKSDETISYSGNSAPRYHFYRVSVSDNEVISITETSASGSIIGKTLELKLDRNNLMTLDGKKAGTITNYDKSHSWDNLRIEWAIDFSPISFNAPVISTYML